MPEEQYYRLRVLKKEKDGNVVEDYILEINGDKSSVLLSSSPHEDVLTANLEKLTEEQTEEILRKEYEYNPSLKKN